MRVTHGRIRMNSRQISTGPQRRMRRHSRSKRNMTLRLMMTHRYVTLRRMTSSLQSIRQQRKSRIRRHRRRISPRMNKRHHRRPLRTHRPGRSKTKRMRLITNLCRDPHAVRTRNTRSNLRRIQDKPNRHRRRLITPPILRSMKIMKGKLNMQRRRTTHSNRSSKRRSKAGQIRIPNKIRN